MTTHLTHDGDVPAFDEEEPELVIIDDDEFEAAHRDDYADEDDGLSAEGGDGDDDDEFGFSFEDDLDEAIALDMSDEMDPTVEDADDRMAALFSALRESAPADGDDNDDVGHGVSTATAVAGLSGPALSKQEAKAEEKRQRETLKRRKEMDKAALEDDKERQREEKEQAAADERAAVAAQKDAVEVAKRQAAVAKTQAAEAKKQEAEDMKRAAAEAKVRQAQEKAQAKAEAKRSRAEAKRQAKGPIPADLSSFVLDEQAEPAETRTRKDATAEKREGAKRALLVVVVVVLLVVAGVAVYAKTRPNSTAGAGAASGVGAGAASLPAALASTVSANTADVAYALDISGTQPATVNGGGSVDLGTQGSNLSVTYTLAGRNFPEQIVYDGGQAFYDLGAIVHYVTPGYDWVSIDLAPGDAGVPGIAGGVIADPSALISLLAASDSSAREVGRVQVDGAPATKYAISLDQAGVTRVLASSGLPSFVRAASYSHLSEQAYVDSSGHLSRIVAVGTYVDSGQTATASTTLDLSHNGTPVSVAPPPPIQVVPEQQFEANAARIAHAPTP